MFSEDLCFQTSMQLIAPELLRKLSMIAPGGRASWVMRRQLRALGKSALIRMLCASGIFAIQFPADMRLWGLKRIGGALTTKGKRTTPALYL
jgi:hypothetical protein